MVCVCVCEWRCEQRVGSSGARPSACRPVNGVIMIVVHEKGVEGGVARLGVRCLRHWSARPSGCPGERGCGCGCAWPGERRRERMCTRRCEHSLALSSLERFHSIVCARLLCSEARVAEQGGGLVEIIISASLYPKELSACSAFRWSKLNRIDSNCRRAPAARSGQSSRTCRSGK